MKKIKPIYWIIGIVLVILLFSGIIRFTPITIIGWDENNQGDLYLCEVSSPLAAVRDKWLSDPEDQHFIDSTHERTDNWILDREIEGYTECWTNKYQSTREGIAYYYLGCCEILPPICDINEVKEQICGDGSIMITDICNINGQWDATNNVCCETEGQVQYCETNPSIVKFRCETEDWIRINECPFIDEDEEDTSDTTIVYVEQPSTTYYEPPPTGVTTTVTPTVEVPEDGLSKNMIALIVAGLVGLYFLTSKPKPKKKK